jgi:hypothetical protein
MLFGSGLGGELPDRTPSRHNHEEQVDAIKRALDGLVQQHRFAEARVEGVNEIRAQFGGRELDVAEGARIWRLCVGKEIASIHAKVIGTHPRRRRRVALMRRIERLAKGHRESHPDLELWFEGAYHRAISDRDLEPVVRVWKSGPGGKRSGSGSGEAGKWIALAQVLERHWGEKTKPATLATEWNNYRRKEKERATRRNR